MRLKVLVTAGPTREKIDPVRFISNYSTGTFGYSIAKEARRRGHRVTLISGPTALKAPRGVKVIGVESAVDMRDAVAREIKRHDCLIMAAAVSDWRPRLKSKKKIKRSSAKKILELVQNPDIIRGLRRKNRDKILVGFALETEDLEKNAFKKLRQKRLDIIVANRLTGKADVFGDRKVKILMIDRSGKRGVLRPKSKSELAKIILDKAEDLNI